MPNIDWLPPAHTLLGIEPTTQACALTRIKSGTLQSTGQLSTEPNYLALSYSIYMRCLAVSDSERQKVEWRLPGAGKSLCLIGTEC